ncbi:unnamed protein product [Choristocarpus tenellus]
MAFVPSQKKIIAGGQNIHSFKIQQGGSKDVTDELPVLAVSYNPTNLTFITVSACALKVWDGATGKLIQSTGKPATVLDRVEDDFMCMCLGGQGRKVIVGDNGGRIKVFNCMNQSEMIGYQYPECNGRAHYGDVSRTIYVKEHSLLISTSGDRSISIHGESQDGSGLLLRRVTNATWSEITALAYSPHLGLIASASEDGSIQLWEFEHGRHMGVCAEQHPGSVTCVTFLDPFPILLSTDLAGNVVLWGLPPARVGLRFVSSVTKQL